MRATIFGISGCTNGGKTTISKKLIEEVRIDKLFNFITLTNNDIFS